jgi:EAL domain-containing protein (putative c-di-GMP-specific phosphodiesterase class I)
MNPITHGSPIALLRDSGLAEFAADDLGSRMILRDAIYDIAQSEDLPLELQYDDERQLLRLLSSLHKRIGAEDTKRIQYRITYSDHNKAAEWLPLSELLGEVGGRCVAEYILHRTFTTYLQPVVQPSGQVMGYEFLLRPLPEQAPFRPKELFETAKRVGHHSFLDQAARHSAIRMGACHLKNGVKRFINFLPSSLHHPATCLQGTFDMIKDCGTDPEDYVFEVMESEALDDPALRDVFDTYRREGIHLALDDVGKGFTTLDAVDELQPDYVKMDRRWVSHCHTDSGKQRYIDKLLDRVSRFHGVLIAEGVERLEEWDYLRKAGIPLFQGYLFGKASPVPVHRHVAPALSLR